MSCNDINIMKNTPGTTRVVFNYPEKTKRIMHVHIMLSKAVQKMKKQKNNAKIFRFISAKKEEIS